MFSGEGWSDRSARLPLFDGEKGTFSLWWMKFETYAITCGFHEALLVGGKVMLPISREEVDQSTNEGKAKMLARRRNAAAINAFSMAFQKASNLVMITRSKCINWPEGLAWKVVQELMDYYKPTGTMTKVDFIKALNSIKMEPKEDPSILFDKISELEVEYGGTGHLLDQETVIGIVISAVPPEYHTLIALERRLRGSSLTMSDLRIALTEFWKDTIKGRSPSTTGSSTASELSLSVFTGKCYRCGEEGHWANTCTAEVADGISVSRGQFRSNCNLCSRVGHKALNCWEREDNRDRRPPGFVPMSERVAAEATRSGREQGHVSVDEERVMENEVLLYGQGLTFPRKPQLLNDPNLWIADSGASVHSTPFCHRLTNLRTPGDGAGITMGNGETEMVTTIGNIRCAWCNKHGTETCRINLMDVTVLPGGKYNLFSLGSMMKKGWQMSGDDQGRGGC